MIASQNRNQRCLLRALMMFLILTDVNFVSGFQQLSASPLVGPTVSLRWRAWSQLHVISEDKPNHKTNSISVNGDQIDEGDEGADSKRKISLEKQIEEDARTDDISEDSVKEANNGKGLLLSPQKKRMGLMWCAEQYCKDAVRERVLGKHNQIVLDGPATGQVAYYWCPTQEQSQPKDSSKSDGESNNGIPISELSILLLVRPNDDELLGVAAKAVEKLTSKHNIHVSLDSDLAAKFKYHYNVDNRRIHLFEARPIEGFGGSHVDSKDKLMHDFSGVPEDYDQSFDLICTLGGDGLLMHAGMLFQGPVPPVLSIAGGSLGFLTQFSKEEMVEAVQIALGQLKEEFKHHTDDNVYGIPQYKLDNVFPPNMPSYPYPPLKKTKENEESPRFNFGLGDRICLSIRMRLECRIYNREGVLRARFNVLNEVVVDRGSSPYLAALECFCDDVHLTTVQADGVIFATPTGSTAYSMAAGGSVVHPAVPSILVTPICPHALSFRSMVFPDHVVLRCYVPEDARADASVAFDGRYRRELHRGDSLQIQMSPYPVPTINRADHSSDWLGSLKRSFNFNTRPRQKPL